MKRSLILALSLAVVSILLMALAVQFVSSAPPAQDQSDASDVPRTLGMDIVVTSTADSGLGTLRWAMANAASGDVIVFNPHVFPPAMPVTISVTSQLPSLVGNVTIDASNAGVIVDGTGTPPGDDGFFLTSNGNTIKGLQILHFAGDGVVIKEGAQNNTIGGDRMVGDAPTGEGNVISGNGHGIRVEGSGTMSNTVIGNLIGTDVSGTAAISNRENGVVILHGAQRNRIGGDTPGERNIISGNGGAGVRLAGSDTIMNTITRNSIYSNDGLGIELEDGGNLELPAPEIIAVTIDFINGSAVTGTACSSCTVEVFTDGEDEGRIWWGSTTADALGDFTFTGQLRGAYVTATATDAAGNTSEFSNPVSFMPWRLYLPLVTKT